uniref:Uncharacterized protein n=1 Tax=Noctiluca scintillans TaxID=2966 RepID=A0A7S1ACU5_NOCSC|mmetsp:Transcript_40633/g.107666  ORF Transcript_40633/g.107666 Transcript_40633/m.107666 type:complete len:398 (+) Transcript_40633:50-1243(+)
MEPLAEPMVQHTRKVVHYEEERTKYWNAFRDETNPKILKDDGLVISEDGGLSDIDELMYPMQYFSAGLIIVFCFMNGIMLSVVDLRALAQPGTSGQPSYFLLTNSILSVVFPGNPLEGHVEKVVPFLELLYFAYLLFQIFYECWKVWRGMRTEKDDPNIELQTWLTVSNLCWDVLPQLSSYSAIRLLYFVTPSVVGTQAYNMVCFVQDRMQNADTRMEKVWPVLQFLRYLLFLVCALVIGFDAFLVKFRLSIAYVQSSTLTLADSLAAFTFLFQILGVVNLNWFVKERLFIFIFGGEDGRVDIKEKARWDVWVALIAKKVFDQYGVMKGLIVLLAFDDYDFQQLVLDDDGKLDKMRSKNSGFFEASHGRTVPDGFTPLSPRQSPRQRASLTGGTTVP